jgi:hypothetical protein
LPLRPVGTDSDDFPKKQHHDVRAHSADFEERKAPRGGKGTPLGGRHAHALWGDVHLVGDEQAREVVESTLTQHLQERRHPLERLPVVDGVNEEEAEVKETIITYRYGFKCVHFP